MTIGVNRGTSMRSEVVKNLLVKGSIQRALSRGCRFLWFSERFEIYQTAVGFICEQLHHIRCSRWMIYHCLNSDPSGIT